MSEEGTDAATVMTLDETIADLEAEKARLAEDLVKRNEVITDISKLFDDMTAIAREIDMSLNVSRDGFKAGFLTMKLINAILGNNRAIKARLEEWKK